MTTNPLNNYEELAEQLRDFLLDYSWLFNFSNINIIIDDFIGKVIPKDWLELLTSISSPQKLKEILKNNVPKETDNHTSTTSSYILPHTFRRFVQRRYELVQELELFGSQWCITPSTLDLKSHLRIINRHQRLCEDNIHVVDKMCRRMSPKKLHEVVNFSTFIHQKFDTLLKPSDHLIDIGSGLGYLDQFLCQIYNYKTIGVESSNNHSEGAKNRNSCLSATEDWKPKQLIYTLENKEESIELLNNKIDEHLENTRKTYACTDMAPNTDGADDKLVPKPAVLVGLHACGDLSNSTLKLFVSNPDIQGLSLVSCCYHKMIQFPLSTVFKQRIFADRHKDGSEHSNAADRLSCLKSPHALRLASQEPFTRWCKFTNEEHKNRGKYLGYRAILEALNKEILIRLEKVSINSDSENKDESNCDLKIKKLKRRGLTKLQMDSYETFRDHALTRYNFKELHECDNTSLATKIDSLHQVYQKYFDLFEYIVGLQNFIQIILEWFVTLDRLCFLKEMKLQPIVYQIFDKDISPRNNVIYCLKSNDKEK